MSDAPATRDDLNVLALRLDTIAAEIRDGMHRQSADVARIGADVARLMTNEANNAARITEVQGRVSNLYRRMGLAEDGEPQARWRRVSPWAAVFIALASAAAGAVAPPVVRGVVGWIVSGS